MCWCCSGGNPWSLLREEEVQSEGGGLKTVCVRACFLLFLFHRLRHSEAGVWGRLNMRTMRDDRYLNLSTWVLPDPIPDEVALMELGAQSETPAGWILTQFHSRLIFQFHYCNWRRCQTNREKCANLVRSENSTHTLHHHVLLKRIDQSLLLHHTPGQCAFTPEGLCGVISFHAGLSY